MSVKAAESIIAVRNAENPLKGLAQPPAKEINPFGKGISVDGLLNNPEIQPGSRQIGIA